MMKRIVDIVGAFTGIVVFAPVMAVVALVVWFDMGRPVLFRQVRPGRNGKLFEMYKFRSMRDLMDADGRPLADFERLTAVGRSLRATSLDELPELWNVLVGDMSLVGPRPLLVQYLPLYTKEQARRHEVRPGLTGWAQINGRNALTWEEKFDLDVWYVDNRNLLIDFRILAQTVLQVLRRTGINAEGTATMPLFTGTAENEQ